MLEVTTVFAEDPEYKRSLGRVGSTPAARARADPRDGAPTTADAALGASTPESVVNGCSDAIFMASSVP